MKKTQKRPVVRTIVLLLLTILLGMVLEMSLHVTRYRGDRRLSITLQIDRPGVCQLFVNDRILRSPVERGNNHLVFKLPSRPVKQIRLKFAEHSSRIVLQGVGAGSFFRRYRWEGPQLDRLISFFHDLKREEPDRAGLVLKTGGREPYLVFTGDVVSLINRLGDSRIYGWLLLAVLAGLIFLLLHHLTLRNLGNLFSGFFPGLRVFGFLIFIFFPLINSLLRIVPAYPLEEKRAAAPAPVLRFDPLFSFFRQHRRYYRERMVYRSYGIHLNNALKLSLFGHSPLDKVLLGKERWLFYARDFQGRQLTDYYRNLNPFTPEELDRWAAALQARRGWLQERGILHLLLVVPNKATIYPDYLPDRIRKANPGSRLDQLLKVLKEQTAVDFIDLRPVLRRGRETLPVYHRTDSHWNDYGAYLTHRAIIRFLEKRCFPVRPQPLDAYRIRTVDSPGGDLAVMLSLEKRLFREQMIRMVPRTPPSIRHSGWSPLKGFVRKSSTRCPAASLSGALLVHDSFVHQLRPFLAPYFKHATYIWDWDLGFYPGIIEKEKPVIVIEEMAERALLEMVLKNPLESPQAGAEIRPPFFKPWVEYQIWMTR